MSFLKKEFVKEKVIIFFILTLFFIEAVFTINGGYFVTAEKKEAYKELAVEERNKNVVIPGKIFDRNGELICDLSDVDFRENYGVYTDTEIYSPFLGYIREEKENSEGLIGKYYSVFFDVPEVDGKIGNNMYLTIDSWLQKSTYDILKNFVGDDSKRASAVIMDAETGEILSMVSLPTYNPMNDEIPKVSSIAYADAIFPGSTFKVLTTVTMLENGQEEYVRQNRPFRFTDTNDYDYEQATDKENYVINYHSNSSTDELNYEEALKISSNVFFAGAMLDLKDAESKMTDVVKRIHIGEDWNLDFGTVKSLWSFDEGNISTKMSYEEFLANTAYGQGETKFSAINNAVVSASIVNGGHTVTPCMVNLIIDSNGKQVNFNEIAKKYNIEGLDTHENLIELTDSEIADKIKSAMISTAEYYNEKNDYCFDELWCEIGAKTGTAEIIENEFDGIWIISFSEINGHKYSVVLNEENVEVSRGETGSSLVEPLKDVYICIENLDR